MKNSKCHQIFIISEFFASFVIDFIVTIPINRVIVGIISQNDVMLFSGLAGCSKCICTKSSLVYISYLPSVGTEP